MFSDRLTSSQLHTLVTYRENLTRAADLLQSLLPDQWNLPYKARKLCERATGEKNRSLATEQVVSVFAGFQRACRMLGPSSQEELQTLLAPVIEKLGLTEAINRATDAAPELAGVGRR